ncbi:hypothetical protein [Moorena producens]|nr:hypothetical protein [Moorena producens]
MNYSRAPKCFCPPYKLTFGKADAARTRSQTPHQPVMVGKML